ncbi:maleylpyruvate isomerase family mycothiol-dependent enzyme [Ornithinimicrobium cerasi]|uniref:maleylpyruvate isomerase family mycothiol-dependent enzyme n=1 Tax=Ornithinimicrobium cerasi TaxID=2248773 RepID=UPI000EFFE616|nr:maleylpyruvate isomerase family mycothiol-dependent enzyme [Ornithinimicrobium cerasi]
MPVHPSPPSDVPSLIEAYRHTLISFADVADGMREDDWARPTTCPGWTARDILAHVVHVEDYLTGSEHPAADWVPRDDLEPVEIGAPEHVRHAFGVWVEEGVRARQQREPADLLAELRGLVELRSAHMYDPDLTLETPVRSVMDASAPFGELTRLRISDVWVHEQDLREMLNRPGSLDAAGASQFVDHVVGALPRVVLRRVRPEPGTVIILESTGPVMARGGVRIGTDADGELVWHELFAGHTEAAGRFPMVHEADEEDRATTIAMSTHELTRRAAGRRTTEDTAYHVVGDEDLARRVVDALAVTP